MFLFNLILFSLLPAVNYCYLEGNLKPLVGSYTEIIFLPDSKMFLTGNSNVSSYSCDCSPVFDNIPLQFKYEGPKAIFQNISIEISTTGIDCHQDLYNSNIKKTLDADNYPFITLNLMEAWKSDLSLFMNETEWFKVIAKTNLIIRETTRIEEVDAIAMKISDKRYRIKGKHVLNMSDYNLEAPKFLFGLIQIEDQIVFNFDLIFEII